MILPLAIVTAPAVKAAPLLTVLRTDQNTNGVTQSRDGRIFLCYPTAKPGQPRVVEWTRNGTKPFPAAKENLYRPGDNPATGFIAINSLRVGPDGNLWLVDIGAPAIGKPNLPGGPKIVQVDLRTNTIRRTYTVTAVTKKSNLDDVRFHGNEAYITDAGQPGIIVLDLRTGESRRVLDGHPSTIAKRPLIAEGKVLKDRNGKVVRIHADQMEVTANGKLFYYQPCCGPMSVVETRWLAKNVSEAERARHVRRFADTPPTGGTAIDASGNVYVSDVQHMRILKYAPSGSRTVVTQDPRLIWGDAMWIDNAGYLWIPAAQMNRTAGLNGGKDRTVYPVYVYKLRIGAKPVRR